MAGHDPTTERLEADKDPTTMQLRHRLGAASRGLSWLLFLIAAGLLSFAGCASGDRGIDCRLGPACQSRGWCSWGPSEGRCVARGDDCEDAAICEEVGACSARQGVCEREDSTCAEAPACAKEGLCHGQGAVCVAIDDQDCAGSAACKADGRCRMVKGRCERVSMATVPPVKQPIKGLADLPEACQRLVVCMHGGTGTGTGKGVPGKHLVAGLMKAMKGIGQEKLNEMCEQAVSQLPSTAGCN